MIIMMFISASYYLDLYMQHSELIDYRTEGELDSTYIGMGEEYLPVGTDSDIFDKLSEVVYPGKDVEVSSAQREKDAVTFECRNRSGTDSYVDVSLLAYRYYHAVDTAAHTELPISMNDNKCIRVSIPNDYEGTIRVKFTEPLLWRVSEIVTLLSGILLLLLLGRRKTGGH